MTIHRENVPAPRLPRDEILADPARCHLSADGDHLLCYDAQMMVGAIYHRPQKAWLIHSGITATQWLQALVAADLRPQHVGDREWSELVALAAGRTDANRH